MDEQRAQRELKDVLREWQAVEHRLDVLTEALKRLPVLNASPEQDPPASARSD